MANFPELVAQYIDSFNETNPDGRRHLIEELYTEDARYTDPQVAVVGPEQIDSFVQAVQHQFPGYVFALGSDIDAHHEQARFNWHATAPGADDPAFVGFDVLIAENDRVRSVYGFLDRVPIR
jgi:hypothetical protein